MYLHLYSNNLISNPGPGNMCHELLYQSDIIIMQMSETFTMALAILKCHGSRVAGLSDIKRQPKDVLTLDYMGLKFKVASENADKVARLIEQSPESPGMFDKEYQFNGGTEYDSFPIYKIVETISREFKKSKWVDPTSSCTP